MQCSENRSTIIYHILNLQSVECDKNRVNYKNINIIFDEIEICFHPEYQREFVNGLINALKFAVLSVISSNSCLKFMYLAYNKIARLSYKNSKISHI